MASSITLRKAIGAVKDQTSIGIARIASQKASELKVAIVRATSHDAHPPNPKYIDQILNLTSYSRLYVNACIATVSRRLGKTRNWVVALKLLMLIHRLLIDGHPAFHQEIIFATRRRGTRLLHMSDFRDQAHPNGWDHSAFVRTYALFLDQKLECLMHHTNLQHGRRRHATTNTTSTPVRDMEINKVLERMSQFQRLLDRLLACRPIGLGNNCKMVFVALYPVVMESFQLYGDICEVLSVLLDRFFDMEYTDCLMAFEAYASVAKQIDELVGFYNWCKDTGVATSSEFPEVQTITDKMLETLEEFLSDKRKPPQKTPEEIPPTVQATEEESHENSNEMKALPAPENYKSSPEPQVKEEQNQNAETMLIDIREDLDLRSTGNQLALALFQGNEGSNSHDDGQSSAWEAFDKADWELVLVESASDLSKQKTRFGGGLDLLLLNGMYDQGIVRQHMSTTQLGGGSASSVALPGFGMSGTQVLGLPAPDGSTQTVGDDPFAASLSIPPPSYVQMADMEKKQQLLVQEQKVWEQYTRNGMQGQVSLANISGAGYYNQGGVVPYGVQPINGASVGYYHYRPC